MSADGRDGVGMRWLVLTPPSPLSTYDGEGGREQCRVRRFHTPCGTKQKMAICLTAMR